MPKTQNTLLILRTGLAEPELWRRAVEALGEQPEFTLTLGQTIDHLQAKSASAVICAHKSPGVDGFETLQALHKLAPELLVLVVMHTADTQTKTDLLASGAKVVVASDSDAEEALRSLKPHIPKHEVASQEKPNSGLGGFLKNILQKTLPGAQKRDSLKEKLPLPPGDPARPTTTPKSFIAGATLERPQAIPPEANDTQRATGNSLELPPAQQPKPRPDASSVVTAQPAKEESPKLKTESLETLNSTQPKTDSSSAKTHLEKLAPAATSRKTLAPPKPDLRQLLPPTQLVTHPITAQAASAQPWSTTDSDKTPQSLHAIDSTALNPQSEASEKADAPSTPAVFPQQRQAHAPETAANPHKELTPPTSTGGAHPLTASPASPRSDKLTREQTQTQLAAQTAPIQPVPLKHEELNQHLEPAQPLTPSYPSARLPADTSATFPDPSTSEKTVFKVHAARFPVTPTPHKHTVQPSQRTPAAVQPQSTMEGLKGQNIACQTNSPQAPSAHKDTQPARETPALRSTNPCASNDPVSAAYKLPEQANDNICASRLDTYPTEKVLKNALNGQLYLGDDFASLSLSELTLPVPSNHDVLLPIETCSLQPQQASTLPQTPPERNAMLKRIFRKKRDSLTPESRVPEHLDNPSHARLPLIQADSARQHPPPKNTDAQNPSAKSALENNPFPLQVEPPQRLRTQPSAKHTLAPLTQEGHPVNPLLAPSTACERLPLNDHTIPLPNSSDAKSAISESPEITAIAPPPAPQSAASELIGEQVEFEDGTLATITEDSGERVFLTWNGGSEWVEKVELGIV